MRNGHPWTDAEVATLRRLWRDGISCAEIGRQLGLTKNAVIGKADRLALPARSFRRSRYAARFVA